MNEQAIRVSFPGTTLGFLHRVWRALESILHKIQIIKALLSLETELPWHCFDFHVHLLLQPRISGVIVLFMA